MKITIDRDGLLAANNRSINDFLKTKPQNKLFRFDTTDSLKPEDFGIRTNAYREERIGDKGYVILPFSFHHLPLYSKSSITRLLSESGNSSVEIPARTRVSSILPLNINMDDITPEQLAKLLDAFKQKETQLEREKAIHDRNISVLESQDTELKEREENILRRERDLKEEQQKLEAEKVEFNLKNSSSNQREIELEEKTKQLEKDKIANENFRNKLNSDMEKLTKLQLESPIESPIDSNTQNDDVEKSTSQEKAPSPKTIEPSAPAHDIVNSNSAQTEPDPRHQSELDKMIKLIADQNLIANAIKSSSDMSQGLTNDRSTPRDIDILKKSKPEVQANDRFLDTGSHMSNIPVPLLNDYNAKNIDDFIEALTVIKKYYKNEHSLILTILLKSKKMELIPLMSVSEREDIAMFSKFLRRFYNSTDYYSLREKYENLRQDQENSVVYLRKVMRLYYISKNLEPPSELKLVMNEAVQKDITYKFLRSLKSDSLAKEITLRDPSWNELPELSSRLEDIHRRIKGESVSSVESVNEIKCFNCGSRSHLANECRASRKDRRTYNRKERRESRGRSRNRSNERSRERYPYRKSPYPSQNFNRRSSSRDRDTRRYRSRSQSYRSSRSPSRESRERYRSKSAGRGDSYNRSENKGSSRSPYRSHRNRSSSREYRKYSKSPKRESNDRKVKFDH